MDAHSKRRREPAEREKRLEDLAVRVLVAVRERDAAVADADRRAGQALHEMTDDEGLSVREAVEWCGDEITTREATRLRRLVEDDQIGAPKVDDSNSTAGPAEGLALGVAREAAHGARRSRVVSSGGISDGAAAQVDRAGAL